MIYEVDKTINKIELEQVNPDKITVGYLTIDQLKKVYGQFGFADMTITECCAESANFRSSIDIYDAYSFGILNIIDTQDIYGARDKIGFYIKKNLFFVIDILDEDNSTKEIYQFAIHRFKPENTTLEKIIYGFFERLLYNDNKALENMEFEIGELEEDIHAGDLDREFISDIMSMKKELTILRNYYEQLIDIGEELQENENDLFNEEDLRYFKMFTTKVERLSNNTLMLKENLVQVREAYTSSLDYNLNSIMKLFTVVTTIFMPLTLIVGWYGMNFTNMPEITWRYGYVTVIGLSVIVVLACILIFKRKKLL